MFYSLRSNCIRKEKVWYHNKNQMDYELQLPHQYSSSVHQGKSMIVLFKQPFASLDPNLRDNRSEMII